LGKFGRVLKLTVLVYFMAFGLFSAIIILYGHFVYFVFVWYILCRFGILYEEKSGNTELELTNCPDSRSL
jgi:hypothetical protein